MLVVLDLVRRDSRSFKSEGSYISLPGRTFLNLTECLVRIVLAHRCDIQHFPARLSKTRQSAILPFEKSES